ncbi:MAG: hypothetical protein M1828_001961 [Chrysothrix sp. TS-e1954]|nr:MAG: hypothetical protein M1828_001961 [Chrysothrix sp. TS-e1954]
MSLLQHEELAIYQLRTAYLAHIHDGIGERLINVDTSFLNDPAFRAAGWKPDTADIKRTYSPPIPTAGASEYFQAPPRSAGLSAPPDFGVEDEEGGIVTGAGSHDTIGPAPVARRRRRKEQLEENDSSDLSDESNEDAETSRRPANQIRFAKMPGRSRADSSPIRSRAGSTTQNDGPSLMVTSPSRPPDSQQRLRAGSLSNVDAVKARARRDTNTSSDVSSDADLDPSVFKRKHINLSASAKSGRAATERIKEEAPEQLERDLEDKGSSAAGEQSDSDSDSLASGFSEGDDSNSLLSGMDSLRSPPSMANLQKTNTSSSQESSSPRRRKHGSGALEDLPPPRPISTVLPVSALAAAIKAKSTKGNSPFDRFATLSGNGVPDPVYIKLYIPSADESEEAIEMLLRKATNDGVSVTVGDAIGYSLYRYVEDETKPPLSKSQMNVNRWILRISEDGEVEEDFDPLDRTKPMFDFTSNNNRANANRGRTREKPWDEFALCEATDEEFQENQLLTPHFTAEAEAAAQEGTPSSSSLASQPRQNRATSSPSPHQLPQKIPPQPSRPPPRQNPITDHRFALAAFRKDSTNAMDVPAHANTSHATPRMGAPRTLTVHWIDNDGHPYTTPIDVTTDTYMSEVFDQICQILNVEKGLFVLRVTGTSTLVPTDRIVEALGSGRSELDLVRRRFMGESNFSFSGSPGSSAGSPNAPLLLTTSGTPTKMKQKGRAHPLAQQADLVGLGGLGLGTGNTAGLPFKRYNVVRRQPMSFTPSHPRVLMLEGEYMHILPGENAAVGKEKTMTTHFDAPVGKTTTIHFSSVVGCRASTKHPKNFRLVVFREREQKRYDFEASSAAEAAEIVGEIKNGVKPFGGLQGAQFR